MVRVRIDIFWVKTDNNNNNKKKITPRDLPRSTETVMRSALVKRDCGRSFEKPENRVHRCNNNNGNKNYERKRPRSATGAWWRVPRMVYDNTGTRERRRGAGGQGPDYVRMCVCVFISRGQGHTTAQTVTSPSAQLYAIHTHSCSQQVAVPSSHTQSSSSSSSSHFVVYIYLYRISVLRMYYIHICMYIYTYLSLTLYRYKTHNNIFECIRRTYMDGRNFVFEMSARKCFAIPDRRSLQIRIKLECDDCFVYLEPFLSVFRVFGCYTVLDNLKKKRVKLCIILFSNSTRPKEYLNVISDNRVNLIHSRVGRFEGAGA